LWTANRSLMKRPIALYDTVQLLSVKASNCSLGARPIALSLVFTAFSSGQVCLKIGDEVGQFLSAQ